MATRLGVGLNISLDPWGARGLRWLAAGRAISSDVRAAALDCIALELLLHAHAEQSVAGLPKVLGYPFTRSRRLVSNELALGGTRPGGAVPAKHDDEDDDDDQNQDSDEETTQPRMGGRLRLGWWCPAWQTRQPSPCARRPPAASCINLHHGQEWLESLASRMPPCHTNPGPRCSRRRSEAVANCCRLRRLPAQSYSTYLLTHLGRLPHRRLCAQPEVLHPYLRAAPNRRADV